MLEIAQNPVSRPSMRPMSHRSSVLYSLPALLLSAACLLPFLNKAFTIDDPLFLLQAQQIRKHPLHPQSLEVCWVEDNECGTVARIMPGNILAPYYLLPVVNRSNPELFAHLLQIVTLWGGIVATVSLALASGFTPFAACAAGLVLAATPPLLAMASTAMPDVLAMSLGVIGIERFLAWKRSCKAMDGVLSAFALALAPLARVHLVFLWFVAALLLRDDAQIFDLKSWLAIPAPRWRPLMAAAVLFVAALVLTHEPGSGIKPAHMFLRWGSAGHNLLSYFTDWVVAMPLGVAWIVLRNRRLHFWLLAIGLALPLSWKLLISHGSLQWSTLCAGLGAFVIMDIILWSVQSHDVTRLACVLWLALPLAALPYIHLPVKFLVPCAPAAALIVADVLRPFPWRITALLGILAAGTVFGLLVLRADYQFAEMGRQAAHRLLAPRVAAGHRVWFASQWGFNWYAVKEGCQVLKSQDVPSPGDFFARGDMEGWPETLKRLPPALLVESYAVVGPGGRTMSEKDGAGLYTNNFGDLMWVWGTGEWNRYDLWQFR